MEQLEIIEIAVIATDVMIDLEKKAKRSLDLIELASLVNETLDNFQASYESLRSDYEAKNREINRNSFIRHYYEKQIIELFGLDLKPFYTDVEYD